DTWRHNLLTYGPRPRQPASLIANARRCGCSAGNNPPAAARRWRTSSVAAAQGGKRFVVMDTAPTGHTLLLLDATGAYHREIAKKMGSKGHFTT
ncbi:hypothetical protein FK521_30140, partial [Klebsiella pneumoniae]|nr:hypothetical protein [Klebsiella pneumoniae]